MVTIANLISGIYLILVTVLDLGGNSFVLFATIAHKAIKLDKMCVWIIQNLAVVDMVNGILVIIPATITFLADGKWLLGSFICSLHWAYKYSFLIGNIFLIIFLSLNKMVRCLFPLRVLDSTFRQRITVTFFSLLPTLVGPVRKIFAVYISGTAKVRFSPAHGMCLAYEIEDGVEKHFQASVMKVTSMLLVVAPCFILIISNMGLVVLAIRSARRNIKKGNIVIVVLVTAVFVISFAPFIVQYLAYGENFNNASAEIRVGQLATAISSFCNPFIYLATNDAFRIFTTTTFKRAIYSKTCFGGLMRIGRGFRSMISKVRSSVRSTSNLSDTRKHTRDTKVIANPLTIDKEMPSAATEVKKKEEDSKKKEDGGKIEMSTDIKGRENLFSEEVKE